MLDYCHQDVQDTFYINIVRVGLSSTLLEYYLYFLRTVTNQNKKSIIEVIQNLKVASAQLEDLENAIKLVCISE